MPAFDSKMWKTAMAANWGEVTQRTLSLKEKLSGSISCHVRTPNGTDMSLDLGDRKFWADTGLLVNPGDFGNLPAGELAIPPVEGSSKGRMVIEPEVNPPLKGQVVFEVREGKVVNVTGEKGFISWLETTFRKYPLARNIAELGVGTNEKAKPGTTMLELEKILGTIHIAIGDNSTQGGKTMVPLHMDFLFENPTAEVQFADGRILQFMKDGKLLW
jgi:leucyl aminopeptidase (aminopeptidase T)